MERKITSLYRTDNVVVLFFVFTLWAGVLFVLNEVLAISPDHVFKAIAITSGFTVLAALSSTSFALISHLKKNKVDLYTQEIMNSPQQIRTANGTENFVGQTPENCF